MKESGPQSINLKDYQISNYKVSTIDLIFNLELEKTRVTSQTHYQIQDNERAGTLTLMGQNLELKKVQVDGLDHSDYTTNSEELILKNLPDDFTLTIETILNPKTNKTLSGLYQSGDILCTQCEAEGFRKMTYFLDRPDIMAIYTTKIIAEKALYPILLSNGNPVDKGEISDGRHFVTWKDPFPKPSYLFALVAGDLGLVKDHFITQSGKKVELEIYCDHGNEDKCDYAMTSLKKSMKWDEEKFGLEYDLDIYMIVAVDSFNMGAMENKGLNIFNSQFVLARPDTATDSDYNGIEGVIGHEYFHNWTGNRITCRDWFQLTLKEGLTVYRDQEFSSDLNSRTVQRINDVYRLRVGQFPEDSGPTTHPIRPSSYVEINNFYTATIYEKGAEVIRMIETLLGVDGFRKGMDHYFHLYDGQAVTTEDFLHAMSEANHNFDFTQFKNWYSQAGTPLIKATWSNDLEQGIFTLNIEQTGRTGTDEPALDYYIPLKLGLMGKDDSQDIDLMASIDNTDALVNPSTLIVNKKKQQFVFRGQKQELIPSINRNFGAPVIFENNYSSDELSFLMAHDTDLFNRYEAASTYARIIFKESDQQAQIEIPESYYQAYENILNDTSIDQALMAMMILPPAEEILHQDSMIIDHVKIHQDREFFIKSLATRFKDPLLEMYHQSCDKKQDKKYSVDPISVGQRMFENRCLSLLSRLDDSQINQLCWDRYERATNMTDELSMLTLLSQLGGKWHKDASESFFQKWKNEGLVINKWLGVESSIHRDDVFTHLETIEQNEVYDKTIPNIFRSVWGSFAHNHSQFHRADGTGYRVLTDRVIEIDELNPQIAARMGNLYRQYPKLVSKRKSLMKVQLERILQQEKISKNLYEIISKIASSN